MMQTATTATHPSDELMTQLRKAGIPLHRSYPHALDLWDKCWRRKDTENLYKVQAGVRTLEINPFHTPSDPAKEILVVHEYYELLKDLLSFFNGHQNSFIPTRSREGNEDDDGARTLADIRAIPTQHSYNKAFQILGMPGIGRSLPVRNLLLYLTHPRENICAHLHPGGAFVAERASLVPGRRL